jgi:hypothetical protein
LKCPKYYLTAGGKKSENAVSWCEIRHLFVACGSKAAICYQLKTTYKESSYHVIYEPLDFIARLLALVPNPWAKGNPVRAADESQTLDI